MACCFQTKLGVALSKVWILVNQPLLLACLQALFLHVLMGLFPDINKCMEELAESVKSSYEFTKFKFVEPFPKEVQTDCPKCLCTLKQPYIVSCCGYRFCKSCLNPSTESCPLCKNKEFDKLPDRQLERLLNERHVYCLLQDNGCEWTGELAKVSSHLSFGESSSELACQHLPVSCSYCGGHFKRADIPGHQEVCDSRPTQCSYCTLNYPYKDMASHRESCPKAPRSCKNKCSDRLFTEKELHSHLASNCPFVVVPCKYLFAGCEENLRRKEMKTHEDSHMEEHLSLVTSKCIELQSYEAASSKDLLESQEDVAKMTKSLSELAFKHHEATVENKELSMQLAELKESHIRVSNVPPDATKKDIKNLFRQFGVPDAITRSRPDCVFIFYCNRTRHDRVLQAYASRGLKLMKQQLVLEAVPCPW